MTLSRACLGCDAEVTVDRDEEVVASSLPMD